MRRRPHVSKLTVTKGVKPGDPLEVSLILTSWSKTPVNVITLALHGRELLTQGENHPTSVKRTIVHQIATLMVAGELDVGPQTFRARFTLPPHALASFKGQYLAVQYKLHLHVDIPWWPDLTRSYYVDVEPHELSRPPPRPVAHTTEQVGSALFLEVTLDDVVFAPGDVVSGAFALGNLRGREVQSIEMAVVGIEHLAPELKVEGRRYAVNFDPAIAEEGKSQRFQFALQKAIPASYDSLSYVFQVKVKVRRGGELTHRIPIAIAALDRPSTGAAAHRQPELGAGRWQKIWARAGAPLGLSAAGKDVRLTGRIGIADVEVFVDALAEGAPLTADLRFSPWGADFRVQPRSLLSPQRMFPFLAADPHSEAFASRYKAEAREEAQLREILGVPLIQALLAFDDVRVGDDHARAVTKNAGYDQRFIQPFLARVGELARALSDAAARIPPPAAMASMRPAWSAFAAELAGELFPGSMAIRRGQIDGARFAIETLFEDDPDPLGTRVAHEVDPPLDAEVEGAPLESLLASAPPGTRSVYDEVAKGAREVRLLPHAIEVTLEAPLADPAALRGRLLAMVALARRLRGEKGAGPYR
jgi:hypothetical protein